MRAPRVGNPCVTQVPASMGGSDTVQEVCSLFCLHVGWRRCSFQAALEGAQPALETGQARAAGGFAVS